MYYNLTKIGKRIKTERINAGFKTQGSFAKAIGLSEYSRQTVAHWENGSKSPSFDELLKMCGLFHCELGYLLGEYDCKTKETTDIHNSLGLSENAINILKAINTSPYKDTINTLSQLVEHPQFIELLCDIHTHNMEFNQKHYSAKREQISNLATVLECTLDKATKYVESSSKSVITSNFMLIIETLNNSKNKKKKLNPFQNRFL